jgi:acyl phosphate:glycerol-3-phosphate acyltransferase
MDWYWFLLMLLVCYLIGSISFARLVTRLVAHKDIADFEIPLAGSDEAYKVVSIGANSVSRELGKSWGMAVGLMDIAKAFIPTLIVKLLFPGEVYYLWVGLACMAGHIFPVYYRFHGGSGWAVAVGVLLVVSWPSVPVTIILGTLLGLLVFRSVVAATLAWMWLLIPWMWFVFHDWRYVLFALGINLLFWLSMIPEIKIANKYKAEGRYHEYALGSMTSTPMGRSTIKLAERFGIKM